MNDRELEIPFKHILQQENLYHKIEAKCYDILAYLTSNFYGIDVRQEKVAIELGLACEKFLYGENNDSEQSENNNGNKSDKE